MKGVKRNRQVSRTSVVEENGSNDIVSQINEVDDDIGRNLYFTFTQK